MKKLIKNPNIYTFDNTFDDNFAIDFSQLSIEVKYGVDRQHLIECHKRLRLEHEAKISSALNYDILY